jgi:hypothetical protein
MCRRIGDPDSQYGHYDDVAGLAGSFELVVGPGINIPRRSINSFTIEASLPLHATGCV